MAALENVVLKVTVALLLCISVCWTDGRLFQQARPKMPALGRDVFAQRRDTIVTHDVENGDVAVHDFGEPVAYLHRDQRVDAQRLHRSARVYLVLGDRRRLGELLDQALGDQVSGHAQ